VRESIRAARTGLGMENGAHINNDLQRVMESRLRKIVLGLGTAALVAASQAAMAGAIVAADFTGAQTVVSLDGAGNPPVGAFSFGGLTFSESSTGSGGPGWRNLTPYGYGFTDNAGISNITIDLGASYTKAGLDVGIGPATYQVNFFDSSATLLGSVTNSVATNYDTFFAGWESAGGVSKIQIVELSGDNYYVGGFNHVHLENGVAPVPEPETYAMMLAGLGAMAFVARRRKA